LAVAAQGRYLRQAEVQDLIPFLAPLLLQVVEEVHLVHLLMLLQQVVLEVAGMDKAQ
jgi:hypothetical protein